MQPAFHMHKGKAKAAEGSNWEYQLVSKRVKQWGQVTWLEFIPRFQPTDSVHCVNCVLFNRNQIISL